MSKSKTFGNYFNHLIEYQNQLLPDNKLIRDYVIIYDYLMDILEKDEIVAKFLVRKKQQTSSINADILLDLTNLFNTRSYVHEPFLCLTLEGRDNKLFEHILHPFCNKKRSIVSRYITKRIWMALNQGLTYIGAFVRGYQGDIYELSLSSRNYSDCYVRINAYNDDVSLNICLRILIKYLQNPNSEHYLAKPYPVHELNREWLALVPRRSCSMFEVCLPKLENEIKQLCFKLVMILRLFRFLFEKHKQLYRLDTGFLESIVYSEYMYNIRGGTKDSQGYDYFFKNVQTRINDALKNKKYPYFWNERLNLIKYFDNNCLVTTLLHDFNIIFKQFNNMKKKDSLKYEEFFEFFDFKMEPFSYEVDQFGIFKSY
ncbi:uncharacterized protein LOC135961457 [Calliphora vicina]|uniref:uncharacterized protein LOC135961457 n=1 Tax=Calliphora vicina TaxID=7373 RepID=UPI00325C2326